MNVDVEFSRGLLSLGVAALRKHFPEIRAMRDGWVWNAGRDHWEFHGPDKFYWHGHAGNAYEARYKGWNAWMENKGITE